MAPLVALQRALPLAASTTSSACGRLAIPIELGVVFDFLRSERYPERSGTGTTQRANSDEGTSETMRSPYEVPVSPNGQNVENEYDQQEANNIEWSVEASSQLRSANYESG